MVKVVLAGGGQAQGRLTDAQELIRGCDATARLRG